MKENDACLFTISESKPEDGIELDRGQVTLQAGEALPKSVSVLKTVAGDVHNGRLMVAGYNAEMRHGQFVPVFDPQEAILRVQTEWLEFEGEPIGERDRLLWPGADSQADNGRVVLQSGDSRARAKDQLVVVKKGKPVWIIDQENRSMLFNYRAPGSYEWVQATPLEVAKGVIQILKYKKRTPSKMILPADLRWSERVLSAVVTNHRVTDQSVLDFLQAIKKRLASL